MKYNLILFLLLTLVKCLSAQTIQLRYDLPSAAQNSEITVIHKDDKSGLYLGTDRGLFTFNGRDLEHYPLPDSLRNQTITALASHKSYILLGLENGKILMFNGVLFSPFYSKVLPVSKEIRKIVPSKNDELLIASYGDG